MATVHSQVVVVARESEIETKGTRGSEMGERELVERERDSLTNLNPA